jgi:4-amino-4-deoxy-L-arabinose transferase-like glycosyltransferase
MIISPVNFSLASIFDRQVGKNMSSRAFMAILLLALIVRLPMLLGLNPEIHNDTDGYKAPYYWPLSYRYLALEILQGDFSQDLGTRCPGYPALLAASFKLFGSENYKAVTVIQAVLGLLTVAAAFGLWSRLLQNKTAVYLATIVSSFDPIILLNENNILSETLTTFLLFGSLCFIVQAIQCDRWRLVRASLAGLLLAWLALTRPAYQFIAPLYMLVLIIGLRCRPWAGRAAIVGAFCVLSLAPMLAWNLYNYIRFDYFVPMTTQGFILTSHTAALIDKHPERYAPYADVAEIVDRAAQKYGWGIWFAYPEIMKTRNVSFAEASRLSEKLSGVIMRQNPGGYARSVLRAVINFWGSAVYCPPHLLEKSWSRALIRATQFFQWTCSFCFITLCIMLLLRLPGHAKKDAGMLLIMGIVLVIWMASTLPIAVENARYKMPLVPLISGTVAGFFVYTARYVRRRLSRTPA